MITAFVADTPNGQSVAIVLAESGLPFELKYVDLWRGAHKRPSFLALNPAGQIPVIVSRSDTGERSTVTQTAAILLTIAEAAGSLLPTSANERMKSIEWLMAQAADCSSAAVHMGRLRRHFAGQDELSIAPVMSVLRQMISGYYRVLDLQLASSRYVAGNAYSVADILAYPMARALRQPTDEPLPHLARWLEEISARPAVGAALKELRSLHARARQGIALGDEP
jgi:GSH-dependent disulfide-bond oxidoreductase